MSNMPEKFRLYTCPKCANKHCTRGEIRACGGLLTKFLNIQNRRFISFTCKRCGYTEFFAAESSMAGNIWDYFCN